MQFWSLKGLQPYERIRELQLKLVDLRARDLIADTVLFLEHEPVITQGRGLQYTGQPRERHMPVPAQLPQGIAFAESERGGDLTYHGPGQLVVYPICKLDGTGWGPKQDVAGFLRKLEGIFIAVLAEKGLRAAVLPDATGVWVEDPPSREMKKIASIGIAVKRWVTYHGVAINAANDLTPFQLISPCGFNPEVMTRLSDWVNGLEWEGGYWRQALEELLAEKFADGAQVRVRSLCFGQQSGEWGQEIGASGRISDCSENGMILGHAHLDANR